MKYRNMLLHRIWGLFNQNSGKMFFSNFLVLSLLGFLCLPAKARQEDQAVYYKDGKLHYSALQNGDRMPDFSFCGYGSSEVPIPNLPAKVLLSPEEGDNTARIQAALEYVGQLPMNAHGFRGAVVLEAGIYEVEGQLLMRHSGVVLRGTREGERETLILGKGKSRETLIQIRGIDDKVFGDTVQVTDDYIPVNASSFSVDGPTDAGQAVMVVRPSTQAWIDTLRMVEFGGETGWIGWKPGGHTLMWDREIIQVNNRKVMLDLPLTNSLDRQFGRAFLVQYSWPGRISHIGVENLILRSSYDHKNKKDEDHRWSGISMENVQDAWVRQIDFQHFAGSAVAVYKSGRRVTVEDCRSFDPISEIGGERRNTFFTEGQQTLFQRCYSEFGIHDFSSGLSVAGPNAFVECQAYRSFGFSGTQQGWATGMLFDRISIDGQALAFANRMQDGRGAGWTAANSVLWQCDAAKIINYSPPTAQNWAIGSWGQFEGDGYWAETNNHVRPLSLFYAQLEDRLGELPMDPQLLPMGSEPSSSPTVEQAAALTAMATEPVLVLKEWIRRSRDRNPISSEATQAETFEALGLAPKEKQASSAAKVHIQQGRILWDGQLLTGATESVQWWRGSLRPRDIATARPHITRFVPGRYGPAYTDILPDLVTNMAQEGSVAMDHNYGLWYDRRRDDHERVRRLDPEVWPPFYEQPFARSGQGEAWDRLSKYDLSRYNYFYWSRLATFAQYAEQEGILLLHQNYFQHNILEAGAHWADSPWRPANNINATGFPEPPPYAGDKRIFMGEYFYDISHPQRRELHRKYIRQCLDNFAQYSNVLQLTSAEYTGPLHFMEFWLDIIAEWEAETGKDAMVTLSATKDVQDAILEDPLRSKLVEVIDIRYWHPTEQGDYAPPGGKHLAPRQHARQMKAGKENPAAVYEGIRRYRKTYPDKALIYSSPAGAGYGWAVLFGGGSLPNIPAVKHPEWKKSLSTMSPLEDNKGHWKMKNDAGDYMIYKRNNDLPMDLSVLPEAKIIYISPQDGKIIAEDQLINGQPVNGFPEDIPLICWIRMVE
ncbi:hypothetical protein GCM10007049_12650 [Echinicola pacifica]|uniref:DUF6298 domain-containing protein n=2 Tax=Echinicola pacifica TaxID=346377 RepID=A0A918PSQ4_9BACT|nr:hypothetical protein GCM10007049_12650 [Echinicola pacifica]